MSKPNKQGHILVAAKRGVFDDELKTTSLEVCSGVVKNDLTVTGDIVIEEGDLILENGCVLVSNNSSIIPGDFSLSLQLINDITVLGDTWVELSGVGAVWGDLATTYYFDDTASFDTTTGHFTTPSLGGKFYFSYQLKWEEGNSSGSRLVRIRHRTADGITTTTVHENEIQPSSDITIPNVMKGEIILNLAEDEEIWIEVRASNLVPASVLIASGERASHLNIMKIAGPC